MPDIHLLTRIRASVDEVFDSVGTLEGIPRWFAAAHSDAYKEGGQLELFASRGVAFEVTTVRRPDEIVWRCTTPDYIWTGTTIRFGFEQVDGRTWVRFDHGDWSEAGDVFRDCAMSWAYFLESLRALHETGVGTPEEVAPACELDEPA